METSQYRLTFTLLPGREWPPAPERLTWLLTHASVWSRRAHRGRGPGRGSVSCLSDHWRQLVLCRTGSGRRYPSVLLHAGGKRRTRHVHRLVLEAFLGPCPEGREACHNDGDATNNNLSNLRYDTRSAHQQDIIRHGRRPRGITAYGGKLTDADVMEIRRRHAAGESQTDLGKCYSVTQTHIWRIVHARIKRHLL